MSLSYDEVVALTNAESVGGHLIVGIMENRILIGKDENGVFSLTDEGKAYIEELQKSGSTSKPTRKKKQTIDLDSESAFNIE